MDILFDKKGTPKIFQGNAVFGDVISEKKITENPMERFTFQRRDFVAWGGGNCYPDEAERIIRTTSVLQTGLNYKIRCAFGQGVIPVTVEGFDDYNNEIFVPVKDRNVLDYLRKLPFRNYHTAALRDIIKFGNAFPLLIFNKGGDKIVNVCTINARHCRISTDKKKLLVFGNFANSAPTLSDTILFDMLDENDPFNDLLYKRETGKLKNVKAIAFPRITNYFSNNDFYAFPDWQSAYDSGWIDIAHKIPTFLNRAYQNAMSLMWHIQIPASYWEKQFPRTEYKNVEERKQLIQNFMDEFERELTDTKNANKTLFTQYYIDETGKKNGEWIIQRLDSEIKAEERLSTSAAANSEILFSLMVNPSVLGAGLPGGPYSGNAGSGSDIREGLLTSMILSNIEKQIVLDPVELMFEFNGIKNIELKYRNIILTTLDTGHSTQENLM